MCSKKEPKKLSKCEAMKMIPNPAKIPNYQQVMIDNFSKGIFNQSFNQLCGCRQRAVIKGIKDDIKENKGQMKKYKKWAE